MTLNNLLGRSLENVQPDAASIGRLLEAVKQAGLLIAQVIAWIRTHKPELLP